jgi:hypothetical protein
MRPLLIYQSFIMRDNTIETRIFPGVHTAEHYPLSPLPAFSRSTNLSLEKIREFAGLLGLSLPPSGKKGVLLQAAQTEIDQRQISLDAVVDAMARTLYRSEVAPHLATLPPKMRDQLTQARLL